MLTGPGSENQRPFHESQDSKSCLRAEVDIHLSPLSTSPSDIRDSMAGPIKDNADASQNDVPMQDVLPSQKPVARPDDTESEGLIRETPVFQSKCSRMPKYAIQKVNPIRKVTCVFRYIKRLEDNADMKSHAMTTSLLVTAL